MTQGAFLVAPVELLSERCFSLHQPSFYSEVVFAFLSRNRHITCMLKDKLILLVDDEPSVLRATSTGLKSRGFKVHTVAGAAEALKEIHNLKPSIIISDLVMPGTNGFEFFQEIKKDGEFKSLPFVFLTGVDDYYAKKFGKELGGAAYITKPGDLDELEQIIKEKIGE